MDEPAAGDAPVIVATYESGAADEEELNAALMSAWNSALLDPKERKEIAALLGLNEDELDPTAPPFEIQVRGAGTFGAEVLVILAASFVIGFAKGFGETAGRAAGKGAADSLQRLWSTHLRKRLNPPGTDRIGPEIGDA